MDVNRRIAVGVRPVAAVGTSKVLHVAPTTTLSSCFRSLHPNVFQCWRRTEPLRGEVADIAAEHGGRCHNGEERVRRLLLNEAHPDAIP